MKLIYDSSSKEANVELLEGDGDFRSPECVELLKQADIVVTNPPFSLASLYMQQLIAHGKKFLIIGPLNLIKYKDTFPYFMKGQAWPGVNWVKSFTEPGGNVMKMGNVVWYTNLDHKKRHEKIVCVEKYDPVKYPKFDNYDAIEVGKYTDIPKDYAGVMGVPISYLMHHNPEQFEIVQFRKGEDGGDLVFTVEREREFNNINGFSSKEIRPYEEPVDKAYPLKLQFTKDKCKVNGKETYARIFIRRKPVGENAETPAA